MADSTTDRDERENWLHETLSAVIRDAFFDARNAGETMYRAGDDAAARVLAILTPSTLRLQHEVDTLIERWEADRRGYPTDDWGARIADSVLKLCINELRNAVDRTAPLVLKLEAVPESG
jgi:hypothetical protein